MLRRSACGMKRSVFAALSAQPAAGARSKAAATSAPAKRVCAAMQALDRPGIDPPVLLFSEGDLTRSEGKAKTPANSMRPLGLARAVPDAPARRAREGAPRDEATEIGEYRLARTSRSQACGRLPRRASGTTGRAGEHAAGGFRRRGSGGHAEEQQPLAGLIDCLRRQFAQAGEAAAAILGVCQIAGRAHHLARHCDGIDADRTPFANIDGTGMDPDRRDAESGGNVLRPAVVAEKQRCVTLGSV